MRSNTFRHYPPLRIMVEVTDHNIEEMALLSRGTILGDRIVAPTNQGFMEIKAGDVIICPIGSYIPMVVPKDKKQFLLN